MGSGHILLNLMSDYYLDDLFCQKKFNRKNIKPLVLQNVPVGVTLKTSFVEMCIEYFIFSYIGSFLQKKKKYSVCFYYGLIFKIRIGPP
jgi:hypothetical protein